MTLIKSKINFVAWLNSAIYASVVLGVSLFSTPVLAAYLTYEESKTDLTLAVRQDTLRYNEFSLPLLGQYWTGLIKIKEYSGGLSDDLRVWVYLQHIHDPHEGDSALGGQLNLINLNFSLASSLSSPNFDYDDDRSEHFGINHFDLAWGVLTARKIGFGDTTSIRDWNLVVRADHAVPEPSTMLAAALALGWGGWMKRKNSIK